MKITKGDLEWVASQGGLNKDQVDRVWLLLKERPTTEARFDFVHLAYYFGALLIMSTLGWFMSNAWEAFGGIGLSTISFFYVCLFAYLGYHLWFNKQLYTAGGLLLTLAVWVVPLFIFGIEKTTGFWPDGDPGSYANYHKYIKGSWILMEVGTVLAGLLALRFVPFPFITFPICYALWFMSMDLAPLLIGETELTFDQRKLVSMAFGGVILIVSYLLDRKTEKDFSFWGYLFGMLAFWGGLSLLDSGSEFGKFIYFCINMVFILISVLFQRKVFIVFGSFGVLGYIGHLTYKVFQDSILFPFILCGLGIFIIFMAIKLQKNYSKLTLTLHQSFPTFIKRFIPNERGSEK